MQILSFKPEDAEAVVAIIHKDLLEVNSADYPPETIRLMVAEFTPQALKALALKRDMFVAKQDNKVVGTVSLDEDKIFTLFVDPAVHGGGIGGALMNHVENLAKARGHRHIELPASLTAHAFYLKRGYVDVRETHSVDHGTNIVMRRELT